MTFKRSQKSQYSPYKAQPRVQCQERFLHNIMRDLNQSETKRIRKQHKHSDTTIRHIESSSIRF